MLLMMMLLLLVRTARHAARGARVRRIINATTGQYDFNGFNGNGYGVDLFDGCTRKRKQGWLPGMADYKTLGFREFCSRGVVLQGVQLDVIGQVGVGS